MFKAWVGKFDKKIFYTIAVLSLTAAALLFAATYNTADAQGKGDDNGKATNAAPSATFAGTGLGAIPDNLPGTPLNVTFNVSGITGAPSNVEVSHTYLPVHSWAGDINATLIAPNGTSFVIYGRTGQTGASAGDSSDLSGPYNFKDSAAGTNWWAAAFAAGAAAVIPPGDYRTTQSGPQPVTTTSPATNLTAAFAGVANANGTWTLRFTDNAAGDTGSVSAATLTVSGAPATQNVVDFNGDGRTDFAVVRNTGGGPSGQITWFVNLNGPGTTFGSQWGINGDTFVPVDYDGDNKTDIAVWRPVSTGQPSGNAFFYILNSMTNTVTVSDFGQMLDDPSVVGDYDGDGKADVAVYRGGATPGAPSRWFYRGTMSNPSGNISSLHWGQNGDFPAPGDYDGDGRHDFVIQRNGGGGQGAFWRFLTSTAADVIFFGTPTDVIVPGDYDGDGKTDIAVVRGIGGQINWFYRKSSDGVIVQTIFGNSATDFPTHGDYDGDGKTDQAIWRPSATAGASAFWVNGSTSGVGALPFGQNGDYPVANYNRH